MGSPIPSTYLMNNIPRETSPKDLLCSLAEHWRVPGSHLIYELILQTVEREPVIRDSILDDDLSVAIIEYKPENTPMWFKTLYRDPDGFPKKSRLGTLWRGVDLTSLDADKRNEFIRAVMADDIVYAETLAEFEETNVNAQDSRGRTALHWACANELSEMTRFCLTVPGLDSGLRDSDGLTAFDISYKHGDDNETIPTMFYNSMIEIEQRDPDNALLRLLTVSSEPDDLDGPEFPGEALFGPAVRGNLPLVKALMDTGVDLSATTEDEETAVHLAAKDGHAEVVKALLVGTSRGARFNVDAVNKAGLTALHYAAGRGHQEVVEELLLQGADKAAKDIGGRTPLDRAVENRHIIIQDILNPSECELSPPGPAFNNSISEAVLEAVEVDQSTITIPNVVGERQGFPTKAGPGFMTGNPVRPLVQNLTTDKNNPLPVDPKSNIEAKNTSGRTALHIAAAGGRNDKVRELLDRGADIEAKSAEYQWTALHWAVIRGHQETVQILLDRGADIEAKAEDQKTALHWAAIKGHQETVQILLDRGADIEAKSAYYQRTALHCAAIDGHQETVRILLDRGADIEAKSAYYQRTALHCAAIDGHQETVRILLDRGADIEAKAADQRTALHCAAINSHQETVQILLDWGADIEAKSGDYQRTALHCAAINGHQEIVQILLDRGADIAARMNEGQTALRLARKGHHKEVVQVLKKYLQAQGFKGKA